MKKEMNERSGSGLKIGDEDIDWPVKSEGKGTRTIQYPVEQTEGAKIEKIMRVEVFLLCSHHYCKAVDTNQ
jgi:hypothetical protein